MAGIRWWIVMGLIIASGSYVCLHSMITPRLVVSNKIPSTSLTERQMDMNDAANSIHIKKLSAEQNEMLKRALGKAKDKTKYILDWYGTHKIAYKNIPPEVCGKCIFTKERNMMFHPDTGAVIFTYNLINSTNLPRMRRTDQLHVWYTAESPTSIYTMRNMHLKIENRYMFNVTDTYRRDSGIYQPYGVLDDILRDKVARGEHKDISNLLQNKTKLAVAVVSNCGRTPGAVVRKELIDKMKEYGLKVETFGKCFNNIVTEKFHEFEASLKKYKFYLAFENTYHCRDYITEKFFINGFRSGTVPIVWGASKADYEAVAPTNSYIFVEDFTSVKSLVDYINYLDQNDEEYLKYFRWIEKGFTSLPMHGRISRFCQLCRQIHGINVDDIYHPSYNSSNPERPLFTDKIAKRTVKSLRKWFYETENKECFQHRPESIKFKLKFTDF